ncbi:MAG: hypothetical protein LBS32_05290, partial [Clostridiales Family XIII bacterium]|nr:hypothetical protein [Clostridiales Family XIII bacterium]
APSPPWGGGAEAEAEARGLFENEVCDLAYHVLVLLACLDVPLDDISAILRERGRRIGNLKKARASDHDS